METTILIDNLKCGGCAATIKKNVTVFSNVELIEVFPGEDKIVIHHQLNIELEKIKEKLHQIGYPEKGTAEGFDKAFSNAKSYVSCAIGKLTGDEEEKKN